MGIALYSAIFAKRGLSSKKSSLVKVLSTTSMLLFSPSFIRSSDGFDIFFKLSGALIKVKENPLIVYPISLHYFFGNGNSLSSALRE